MKRARVCECREGCVRVSEGRRIQSCLKELMRSMTKHRRRKKEMLSMVQLTFMYCWILEVAIFLPMGELLGSQAV